MIPMVITELIVNIKHNSYITPSITSCKINIDCFDFLSHTVFHPTTHTVSVLKQQESIVFYSNTL